MTVEIKKPGGHPKQMKRVGDLFEKYRLKIKAPQASVEKACVEVVKEVTGFDIKPDQVTYTVSTETLSLQVPSVLKSELRFYNKEILKKLSCCPKKRKLYILHFVSLQTFLLAAHIFHNFFFLCSFMLI